MHDHEICLFFTLKMKAKANHCLKFKFRMNKCSSDDVRNRLASCLMHDIEFELELIDVQQITSQIENMIHHELIMDDKEKGELI